LLPNTSTFLGKRVNYPAPTALHTESAPIKRIISDARERGQLVDATYGRRTRAVIITDSGHVILSAIQPETVANRFLTAKVGAPEEPE
jgi:extracellular matrix regulatory protein A